MSDTMITPLGAPPADISVEHTGKWRELIKIVLVNFLLATSTTDGIMAGFALVPIRTCIHSILRSNMIMGLLVLVRKALEIGAVAELDLAKATFRKPELLPFWVDVRRLLARKEQKS